MLEPKSLDALDGAQWLKLRQLVLDALPTLKPGASPSNYELIARLCHQRHHFRPAPSAIRAVAPRTHLLDYF